MDKPVLAILTQSIRRDNQAPLKYFKKFKPVHFYLEAPYGDLTIEELRGAVKFNGLLDLWQKLKKFKPVLIQGTDPYGSRKQLRLALGAYFFSRFLKVPFFFAEWENRPTKERFGLLSFLMRFFLGFLGKKAVLVFAINQGAENNLREAGVPLPKIKRFLWGLFGVETTVFRPEGVKAKLKILKGNLIIYFTGRLDEAKGIPYLLAAFRKVKKEIKNVNLVLQGRGELENQIKNKGILKLPWELNKNLPPFFRAADLVICPSVTLKRWEEQVGLVNLQALSCGKALVTTRSGAIPEYIKEDKGTILVPERDSSALAEAMINLLNNETKRRKMGYLGRQYILKNFDMKDNVEKGEKILWFLI